MQKIVICPSYPGLYLSQDAVEWLYNLGHEPTIVATDRLLKNWKVMAQYKDNPLMAHSADYERQIERDDPLLVRCVEVLGGQVASGRVGHPLVVVEIPDGVAWYIDWSEGDGEGEFVTEKHRVWGKAE